MKLVVGLGNPGREYENTRHNVGFNLIDMFLKNNSINDKWNNKFNGLFIQTLYKNEKVIFLKPQSFMNLSGGVVRKFIDYFDIDIEDVLIISDDLDLSVGTYKLKKKGSSGGHNGLKNIELHLGTQEYCRIKIGISNNKNIDTKDYVLGKISTSENELLNKVKNDIQFVLEDYFTMSFDNLMNKYNIKIKKGNMDV